MKFAAHEIMSNLGPQFDCQTFEEAIALGRIILLAACANAGKILGTVPPIIREELTLTGWRAVVVWPDGEETNECVIQRIDDQHSLNQ